MLDTIDHWAPERVAKPLAIGTTNHTAHALGELARTEDVRVAPGGKRLAIAGYHKDRVTIFDIDFTDDGGQPHLQLKGHFTVQHASLIEPHGLDFIDEQTLVVGNRAGGVSILDLPAQTPESGVYEPSNARLLRRMNLNEKIHHPGSVCVASRAGKTPKLLVANNYNNRITQHAVHALGPVKFARHKILIEGQLEIPDGITASPDRSIFAVSNHMTHEVLLWRNDATTKADTPPFARLAGTIYPHGLRFTPDGEMLIVVSAGTPTISVYQRPANGWESAQRPDFLSTVVGKDDFIRGNTNEAEGGPKGIDLDPTGKLVIITNEEVPLQTFALDDLLKPN